MNTLLNYLLEANLGLLIFLLFYRVVLNVETDFKFKRIYLIGGIMASLLFPLFKLSFLSQKLPTISNTLPAYMLPMITVGENQGNHSITNSIFTTENIVLVIYATGLTFFLIRLIIQLAKLQRLIKQSDAYSVDNKYKVIEIKKTFPSFSFFSNIVIGDAHLLTQDEREIIIKHECVHVDKKHSFDLLLTELVIILFWFNPVLRVYKTLLTNIHEFQADEKATEQHDVKQYCSLLARVALMSADFNIANHFNNSLTVKRINMMKTMKRKLNVWKVAASIMTAGVFFFLAACQDQLIEATELAKSTTMALDLPSDVQKRFDEIKAANPNKKYSVIEPTTEEATQKFNDLKSHHAEIVESNSSGTKRAFFIAEMNDQAKQIAEDSKSDDGVYTVVEQQAEYPGGMPALYGGYLLKNIQYPLDARAQNISGTVFVEMVVQKDGTVANSRIVKSVALSLDKEALRLVQEFPQKWIPAKQGGVAVSQKLVLPIQFSLGNSKHEDEAKASGNALPSVVVVGVQPASR